MLPSLSTTISPTKSRTNWLSSESDVTRARDCFISATAWRTASASRSVLSLASSANSACRASSRSRSSDFSATCFDSRRLVAGSERSGSVRHWARRFRLASMVAIWSRTRRSSLRFAPTSLLASATASATMASVSRATCRIVASITAMSRSSLRA